MKKLILTICLITSAVMFSGCNLNKTINSLSEDDYYCVVNRDIIGFYSPKDKSCTPMSSKNIFNTSFCKQIEDYYLKGKCRLKKDACKKFGRGEQHELGCLNTKEESLRILLTPSPHK